MTKELFDVCLSGALLNGHNPREVAVNLAQLTGTSIPHAATLLHSAACLKQQVDEDSARWYLELLEETGAEVILRPARPADSHTAQASDDSDEPDFDIPPEPPMPPHPQAEPTLPPLLTGQAPDQAIEAEATPVLDDEPAQPVIAEPAPIPGIHHTRPPRRIRWLTLAALLLLVGTLTLIDLLHRTPPPTPPGHALPQVGETLNLAQTYQLQVEMHWRTTGHPPYTAADLQLPPDIRLGELAVLQLGTQGSLILTFTDHTPNLQGQTLELVPQRGEQGIEWHCHGGTLASSERPAECRKIE